MTKTRLFFFILICGCGVALAVLFYHKKPATRLESTLAPMYQLFGTPVRSLNSALTQLMPVDSLDEKKYGEVIMAECDANADSADKDFIYANSVLARLTQFTKKPFAYKVYIHPSPEPNAFALPGGVIFVTRGLMNTLKSESELAAVLSHELGHIELSHCLDAVRFELLAKKIDADTLGSLVDLAVTILLRHSFSKTQEDNADSYAFELMTNSIYDPAAQGKAFEAFLSYSSAHGQEEEQQAGVIRDYFMSHPPLALRAEKFSEKSRLWWNSHGGEKRYAGFRNLRNRDTREFSEEWVYGSGNS